MLPLLCQNDAFKTGICHIKPTQGIGIKILSSKEMLQIIPIGLVQVKVGNIFEYLLNETRQIAHFFHLVKKITQNHRKT